MVPPRLFLRWKCETFCLAYQVTKYKALIQFFFKFVFENRLVEVERGASY